MRFKNILIILLFSLPVYSFAQQASVVVCEGQQVWLNASNPEPDYTYQWQYSFDNFQWNDVPGGNTSLYDVYPMQNTFFRLKITTDSCEAPIYTDRHFVQIGEFIENPGIISGNTSLCTGESSTFSIDTVLGAANYHWSYSGMGTISGSGPSINLMPTTGGVLSVYVSNDCAVSTTETISISIDTAPNSPAAIIGNSNPNLFESGVVYSISPVSGASSYEWTVPQGAVIANGQGSTVIIVDFANIDGEICVQAENECGKSDYICFTVFFTPTEGIMCLGASQTQVVEITSPVTGRIWMDRNLGAHNVASSPTDYAAYGCLYQWGRPADGHELIEWTSSTTGNPINGTTTILSNTDNPGHNLFILNSSSTNDWRSPQNNNLWQGVNGINNPCPQGFRLPTETEVNQERSSWSQQNVNGAFSSIKLVLVGSRVYSNGNVVDSGVTGRIWTSTIQSTNSRIIRYNNSIAQLTHAQRAGATGVRCIKDGSVF